MYHMTIDQIRKAAFAQPFVPFTVSLGDGRRFFVGHPENIMITPEASRTFIVAESGEDYSIIDMLLVTSIDYKKRGSKNRTNGRSNGKHRPS